jgi:hypothetical protein
MKRVHTTQDLAMLSHLKNALEACGIRCVIRGQHLLGGVGELPPIECWPELWVIDEEQTDEAQNLLRKLLYITGPTSRDWVCTGCGEEIPGQFTDCWNCGIARSELSH